MAARRGVASVTVTDELLLLFPGRLKAVTGRLLLELELPSAGLDGFDGLEEDEL